jgi:hypothetical protein
MCALVAQESEGIARHLAQNPAIEWNRAAMFFQMPGLRTCDREMAMEQ